MTLQNKNKTLLLIVIVLTIINVAAVSTFFFHTRHSDRDNRERISGEMPDSIREHPGPAFLIHELGLNDEQQKKFNQSRDTFRAVSRPIFAEMHDLNAAIIEEISKETPDTEALQQMSIRIGQLHARIKMNTIRHLLEIRKLSTPEQLKKLDFFYKELISRDSGSEGKGKQYRYRHGQNRN